MGLGVAQHGEIPDRVIFGPESSRELRRRRLDQRGLRRLLPGVFVLRVHELLQGGPVQFDVHAVFFRQLVDAVLQRLQTRLRSQLPEKPLGLHGLCAGAVPRV